MPKISVVVPCYNSEKFVADTIDSILSQSWQDWEAIIVNDGSTDGSLEIIQRLLEQDGRLRLVDRANGGVCKARNDGFRASSPEAEYLLFLDADDCIEPKMLETLANYLHSHPQVGIVHCGHRYIDSNGAIASAAEVSTTWKPRLVPTNLWIRSLRPDETITPFCSIFTLAGLIPSICLIRKSVFEAAGGFDEDFGQHYEETDLFLRIALQSEVHYLPEKLVRHRRHPAQSTAHTEKFARQETKLYDAWANIAHLPAEQQKVVRHAIWFRDHRITPFVGFLASLKHLKKMQLKPAARFFAGALRRYQLKYRASS